MLQFYLWLTVQDRLVAVHSFLMHQMTRLWVEKPDMPMCETCLICAYYIITIWQPESKHLPQYKVVYESTIQLFSLQLLRVFNCCVKDVIHGLAHPVLKLISWPAVMKGFPVSLAVSLRETSHSVPVNHLFKALSCFMIRKLLVTHCSGFIQWLECWISAMCPVN